jgi:hypothetical protein
MCYSAARLSERSDAKERILPREGWGGRNLLLFWDISIWDDRTSALHLDGDLPRRPGPDDGPLYAGGEPDGVSTEA